MLQKSTQLRKIALDNPVSLVSRLEASKSRKQYLFENLVIHEKKRFKKSSNHCFFKNRTKGKRLNKRQIEGTNEIVDKLF